MRIFLKNCKKYNLLYAFSFEAWSVLEYLSEIPKIKGISQIYRIQDNIERMLDKYDGHLQHISDYSEEDPIPTPCGCIYFNDCSECSSNSICNAATNFFE